MGRPSLYKPEFPEMLIQHMALGYSYESFAGTIGVSRRVLYDWEKVQPEFLEAKEIGLSKNLLFWETLALRNTHNFEGMSFNTTLWIFNMKNRHGWRDRSEHTLEQKEPIVLKYAFTEKQIEGAA